MYSAAPIILYHRAAQKSGLLGNSGLERLDESSFLKSGNV
jgi:hypothetical protein